MRVQSCPLVRSCKTLSLSCFIVLASAGFDNSAAQAISFQFNFGSGTPTPVIEGFNSAGDLWSSLLVDDITINIDVFFSNLGSNSLGIYNPNTNWVNYSSFYGQLGQDITSSDDAVAFSALPNRSSFNLLINRTNDNPNGLGSAIPYFDNDGGANNSNVWITTANAKALGFTPTGSSDGTIQMNSAFNWDFDSSDGIDSGKFDFVGVAVQGIGSILGSLSGVDTLEANSPQQTTFFSDNQFTFVTPVDLFRFSEESASQGAVDWTTGRTDSNGQEVDKYFSIDGGNTKVASFSTGATHGDGRQARAWKADELTGTYLGAMEPTVSTGQTIQFSANDQMLFDVIGWDLADPFSNPPQRNIEIDPVAPTDPVVPSDPVNPTQPPTSAPEPGTTAGLAVAALAWFKLSRRSRQRAQGLNNTGVAANCK